MKIDIERFGISGATIHAGIWEGSEKNNFTAEGLDLTLLRLSFGSGIPKETLRQADSVPAGVSAVSLSVQTLAYVFKNGALKMEADTLSLDSGKGILSAGRLALLPQYDKYQYAVRVGDHTDWVMLDVREIACSGVSLPYLSGHDMLHADSVSVGSVEIDSYKDRNQLQSPAFRQMLYTSVQRIPVGIDFPVIDARGINIRYDNPQALGADRICNAVAAQRYYGGPCIFIDFGTATTFGVISKKGEFLGGAICPGLKLSSEALTERAAQLPKVELVKPETVITRNTISNMQAGIVYGYVGQVDYIVRKMKSEIGGTEHIRVIATGGLSRMIASETSTIDIIDGLLTLKGLRLLYERNARA